MGQSTVHIPQLVPNKRCFSCDICCRFPEQDSFLRPFFTADEITAAVAAGVPQEFFPDLNGSKINLIPHPSGREGYICPAFDPESGRCRIYEVRPLDCRLYPVALMRDSQEERAVLGMDSKCPYVTERPAEEVSQYARTMAAMVENTLGNEAHPGLIQRHQEDVIYLFPLETLTRTLKGQSE